ncbi:MAG: hypothetical protein DRN16_01835 [Thermoplasmata archaeon]|nr:MAG: hypothetical protein DRN16_01835 [Thermoplasmata archaeon]
MFEEIRKSLLEKIESIDRKDLRDLQVTLMPDFFLDHFVVFDSLSDAIESIERIYMQKGGNIIGVSQTITQGGNAANTALSLAKLGIETSLICKTDSLGFNLLNFFLGENGVDLSGVKKDGKLALTMAIEFGKEKINVMVGDSGSVANFSFEELDEKDLEKISNSDMVCVLDWCHNREGAGLAKEVFKFAKKHNVKTFFDSGDPSFRKGEIDSLFEKVIDSKVLDIFSLNENELRYFSKNKWLHSKEDIVSALYKLKEKVHARIDLHTEKFSLTISKDLVEMPSVRISRKYRSTGAGDIWNAGDIFGELLGFTDKERLLFANTLAACYISSQEAIPPTLDELKKFLPNHKNFKK